MTEHGIINLLLTSASEHGGFEWRFVMEHAVNLIILLGVLIYFLKASVRTFLVERRGTIGHEIDVAQKTINEAKSKYEEYAKKLREIETEINLLGNTLHMEGESERDEILKQAGVVSQNIRKEAKEIIALQTERARREIQTEVVNLALDKAIEVLKRSMVDSDKERFVHEFTKNIEEQKWHQSQH
jgi:F-type H+-transporting ATPase subunit b